MTLILTSDDARKLNELRDRAAQSPVDMTTLSERLQAPEGKSRHMDQMASQTVIIPGPFEFMVTYSVETGHPCGTCRHMSMSINREGRVPHPAALLMVGLELGFDGSAWSDCVVWKEELLGHGVAINLVQPVDVSMVG